MRTAKQLAVVMFIAALLFACKEKSAYHMPPKQMQNVLLDLTVAEAYCMQVKDSLHKGGTKNYDSLAVFYGYILDHHKLTEEQFRQSLDWYKYHPTELDSLSTELVPIVVRWQSKYPNK